MMNSYIHHVPGRLRVRVPAAKGNSFRASRIARELVALEGVTCAEANPLTGSVLVWYDTEMTDGSACLALLKVPVCCPKRIERQRRDERRRMARKVAETASWYLLEKALERSVPLLLSALL